MSAGCAHVGRLSCALAAAVFAWSAEVDAKPSLWSRARAPDAARRAATLAEVDAIVLKHQRLRRDSPRQIAADLGPFYLREAKRMLEQARAAESGDARLRLRFAEVLHELGDVAKAAILLEALVAEPLPLVLRGRALNELAVCYARLGRHEEEVRAYEQALALEPASNARSIMLANHAEARMVLGQLESAIRGYREALAVIPPARMFTTGVTTLWGLSVALDRSGDLEQALATIRLARSYDPADQRIREDGWFYVPPYDEAWYAALGFWSAARHAEDRDARREAYARAIEKWNEYLARAAPGDRWRSLAHVRLVMCEKERDARTRATGGASPRRTAATPSP